MEKRIIKCPTCNTEFDVTREIWRLWEEFVVKMDDVLRELTKK